MHSLYDKREERGQESDGREPGENETKDKISVLTFIAFLPRPPPQLIVSNNNWPHYDWGRGVARYVGEGGRGELRRRCGSVDDANSALPLLP